MLICVDRLVYFNFRDRMVNNRLNIVLGSTILVDWFDLLDLRVSVYRFSL